MPFSVRVLNPAPGRWVRACPYNESPNQQGMHAADRDSAPNVKVLDQNIGRLRTQQGKAK